MEPLVPRITIPPNIPYEALLTRINRFRVYDVLRACNRFAAWADAKRLSDTLQAVPANQDYFAKQGETVYVVPWALAFLAKTSILRSSDQRQRPLRPHDLLGLIYMHINLRDAFEASEKAKPDGRSFLIRLGGEQFPYQAKIYRSLPRAWMIFIEGNRSAKDRPLDLEEEWLKATDIPLSQFMHVGFGYWAGALEHAALKRHFAGRGILADKISVEDCEKFLKLASATYEEFRELSEPLSSDDDLYVKTEPNVLIRRPLIACGDEVICPVPRLLLNRITDGILHDMLDAMAEASRNPFSEYFGKLFEDYVGRLLKWAFSPEAVYREPVYRRGKLEVRGPDWVVIDGDVALVIECRTRRLRLETRSYARPEDLLDDVRKAFVDTVRKLPGKIRDLAESKTPIDASAVRHYESIILLYDRIFFEPFLRDLARDELNRQGVPLWEDYHLLDIDDFETLTAWNDKHPMREVLEDRRQRYAEKPQDMGDFLYQFAMANDLDYAHPLLAESQDEIFSIHFEFPEASAEPPEEL